MTGIHLNMQKKSKYQGDYQNILIRVNPYK